MKDFEASLTAANIDLASSQELLKRINNGEGNVPESQRWFSVDFDDSTVIDGRLGIQVKLNRQMRDRITELLPDLDLKAFMLEFAPLGTLFGPGLAALGLELLPLSTFCVLNGGAATSFVDAKRNQNAYPTYFSKVQGLFEAQAEALKQKPKALAPAYFNPDGTAGYSFLALKLRNLQLYANQYFNKSRLRGEARKTLPYPVLPWVQMVNPQGRSFIDEALENSSILISDPELSRILPETTRQLLHPLSGEQSLVSAFTLPDEQGRYDYFRNAMGKTNSPLGLPGGHGQIYRSLLPQFQSLRAMGKRFIWIGNIDNLGFTPNLKSLAIAALRQTDGLFEFSPKTAIDTKGGVLVKNSLGKLTCADIGQAISSVELGVFEKEGAAILFNCATGLFDLDLLCNQSEKIMANLPLRLTKNNKDIGNYISAEQSMWEILGNLERPIVLALEKSERFLASKFILDSFLTSGVAIDSSMEYRLRRLAYSMNHGMSRLLEKSYGLKFRNGQWGL